MNKSVGRATAVERSRWLAELAKAVDQAQQLARSHGQCPTAEELFDRLERVRLEVESLRRGGWEKRPAENDPLWAKFFPNSARKT